MGVACAEKVQYISVDLQEAPVEVLDRLQSADVRGVTHIFYTAIVETGDDAKNVECNFGMFKTAVEVGGPSLRSRRRY